MRLSVETHVMSQRFGDEAAIDMIKAAGFDAVDYSFYWKSPESDRLTGDYLANARALRAYLDKTGIVCNQAHAPFEFAYGSAMDASNPRWLEIARSVEFAGILGADNIIIHSIDVPKNVDAADYNYTYFKSFQPYAERAGISISVENLFSYDSKRKCHRGRFGIPEDMKAFLRRLDAPCFNVCVDVGHAAITETEPEDYIRALDADLLKSLHVQDNHYTGDEHTIPFEGQLNWDAITKALAGIGYRGDITLEIFGFLGRYPNDLLLPALKLAEAAGRKVISMTEKINE